jgi:hypothetical protein
MKPYKIVHPDDHKLITIGFAAIRFVKPATAEIVSFVVLKKPISA